MSARNFIVAGAGLWLGLLLTGASGPALAQVTSGGTAPAGSEHLSQLENEYDALRAESTALGGSPSPATSINNTKTRINELDDQIERMTETAAKLGATAADLEATRKGMDDDTIFTWGDIPEEAAEQAIEKGLEQVCTKGVGRVLGWITLVGDVVEYGGKKIIKELNESAIRDMVRQERLKLHDLYDLLSFLYCDRAAERTSLKRLEEIKLRENVLFGEIAEERAKLNRFSRRATGEARTARDQDHAGDEEERRLYNEAGVRPVDPNYKRPPPKGVRVAEPVSSNVFDAPSGFAPVGTLAFDATIGGTYSFVDQNSTFGSGTVVRSGEVFAAAVPSHIDRSGFTLEGEVALPGAGFVLGDSYYLFGTFSHAEGTASSSGQATVDIDGVTMLGMTFLEFDGVLGTGVSTGNAGASIDGSAEVSNSWNLATFGYGEVFHPSGPEGVEVRASVAALFEGFDQSFSAESELINAALVSLATQETLGKTEDSYIGVKLSAGFSYPLTSALSAGLSGYLTPAHHEGEGHLSQFTSFGSVSQELDHSSSGFSLSGGIGAHVSYDLSERFQVKLSYEHSWLGDVTELHVPQNPDDQPAAFAGGTVSRDFFSLDFQARF